MVAPASRGSLGESLARAASSACATESPPSREKPRDNSVPAASTMTAPTENAVSDGGHCHASETASRIHCSSPFSIRELYLPAAGPLGAADTGWRQQKPAGPRRQKGTAGLPLRSAWSDVEVKLELVRGRAQPHRVELLLALVGDPGLDEVLGEDAALGEVGVVVLKVVEDGLE